MLKSFKHFKNNRYKEGITLIALVVTIIILLILATVTISLILGPDGIVLKASQSKVAGRYGNVIDKVYARNANSEIIKRLGGTEEDINTFVNKLKTQGLIIEGQDYYDEDEGIIYLGKQDDDSYLYEVELSGDSVYTLPEILNGANSPDIKGLNPDTTYYVTWNTASSPYAINESIKISKAPPTGWSDYNAGVNQWANIKTTGGGNDCYWVWIPRYAYRVPTSNTGVAEEIDIKFLPGKSNTPEGETAITNTTPTSGSWVVHPAFTNAGNNGFGELRGIWVAKYEASSSIVGEITFVGATMSGDTASLASSGGGAYTNQQIRVKPNVTSWREISVNDIFDVTRNMTSGSNSNSSLAGTIGINSHMMKNTEWGAVVYLSRSKYGKNSRVWNNTFYNGTTNYSSITGLAGNNATASVTSTATMHTYNTTGGRNASTTGNVYGVYDMAGGAFEYVAGYLNEIEPVSDSTKLVNAEDKYKDKYAGTTSDSDLNYSLNANKYGDAVYETSSGNGNYWSWDSNAANFPFSVYTVFLRGGGASSGGSAGVYAFTRYLGNANTPYGFRPALVASQ